MKVSSVVLVFGNTYKRSAAKTTALFFLLLKSMKNLIIIGFFLISDIFFGLLISAKIFWQLYLMEFI